MVFCRLEANSSVNDLTVKLLEVLDVPLKYRTTVREKRKLLYRSLKNLRVRMIIFDESQQIIERRTDRVKYQFIDELKLLIDELNIAIVLVGLRSLLEVSTVNSQLERRSYPPLEFKPFDYSDPKSQTEFLQLVASYMQLCSPIEFPNLCSEALSWRLYCACLGRRGLLAGLFQQCVMDCRYAGRYGAGLPDLANAFNRVVPRLPKDLGNPFLDSFDITANKRTIGEILGTTHTAWEAIVEGDRGSLL